MERAMNDFFDPNDRTDEKPENEAGENGQYNDDINRSKDDPEAITTGSVVDDEEKQPKDVTGFDYLFHADSMGSGSSAWQKPTDDGQFEPIDEKKVLKKKNNHKKEKNKKKHHGWVIATAILLCISFCFAGGVAGSIYMWKTLPISYQQKTPDSPGDNTRKTMDTEDNVPTGDKQEPSFDEDNRNPTPEIAKETTTKDTGWSGSAGDAAYATLAEAISHVADSVVEISTETIVNGGWLGNYISSGAGSGVIISTDGYIVTNNHVIAGADTITVRMVNGNVFLAKLIGTDEASDIAVIWIDSEEDLPAANLGCSQNLIVGESVFAIGNPLGSLGGTVTDGIISATARDISINGMEMTLLQTNAAVNPGNSGGGLFNMAGQLVGIVNAKCSEDDVEGLGFAIPIDTAYNVICELIKYGYVRGVVDSGLTLYDVTSTLTARHYFGTNLTGVYVLESKYTNELKSGDLLISIDGVKINRCDDVVELLREYEVGDVLKLAVYRGGETLTVSLTLHEYVPSGIDVRFENVG